MKEVKQNRVVEFIKAHKKGIAITAGLTVAGVAVARIICGDKAVNLPKPEFSIGHLQELWTETQSNAETYINAIVGSVTAADLGRFGEEMTKVDGIDPDSVSCIIIGFKQK